MIIAAFLAKAGFEALHAGGDDGELLEAPFTHGATRGTRETRMKSGLGDASMRNSYTGAGLHTPAVIGVARLVQDSGEGKMSAYDSPHFCDAVGG